MKVGFLGANIFGLNLIKYIVKNKLFKINKIITLKKGSKTVMYDGIDINEWYQFDIPITEIERIENESNFLKNNNFDIIIVGGWRQIIPNDVLSIPKYGFIGFHPTLLPKGRGGAPIINSLLEDYKNTGLSLFKYSDNLDAGDIVLQEKFIINGSDHANDIYLKETIAGFNILDKLALQINKGKILFNKQNEKEKTFFKKVTFKDNEIVDFSTLDKIFIKIRAFSYPYKGAYFYIGKIKIIIFLAKKDNNGLIINEGLIVNNDNSFFSLEHDFLDIYILESKKNIDNTIKFKGYLKLKKINNEK